MNNGEYDCQNQDIYHLINIHGILAAKNIRIKDILGTTYNCNRLCIIQPH